MPAASEPLLVRWQRRFLKTGHFNVARISERRLRAELQKSLKSNAAPSGFLYLSLGDQETEMRETFQRVVEVVRQHAPPGFRCRSEIIRGAEHRDNDLLSTPLALQAYYRPGSAPHEPPP